MILMSEKGSGQNVQDGFVIHLPPEALFISFKVFTFDSVLLISLKFLQPVAPLVEFCFAPLFPSFGAHFKQLVQEQLLLS